MPTLPRLLLLSAAAVAAASHAQSPPPGGGPAIDANGADQQIPIVVDEGARLTVPVRVGGRPALFLVDTGAEISGVADDVAARLGLAVKGQRTIVGFASRRVLPTVILPQLTYARVNRDRVEVLRFQRERIGADGFLGLDSLGRQLVDFDFIGGKMSIRRASARGLASGSDSVVVDAAVRNKHLVFTHSRMNGIKIQALLDTGSSITIGNSALRDQLISKGRLGPTVPVRMVTITGEVIRADYGIAKQVALGDVQIERLPIAFATVEPFRQLGLDHEPALLIGMDALQLFGGMTVDFRNRAVRFVARDQWNRGLSVKMGG